MNLSAPTYGSTIKAYGQAGEVQRVQELWKERQERKQVPCTPSPTTRCWGPAPQCGAMSRTASRCRTRKSLKGNSQPANLRRVVEIIESIEEPIDEVMFSALLEACTRTWQAHLLANSGSAIDRGSLAAPSPATRCGMPAPSVAP